MIDSVFKEQIQKNKILTNTSSCGDVLNINYFSGRMSIGFDNMFNAFGSLNVKICGLEGNITLVYGGITIAEMDKDCDVSIPIKFVKNHLLTITGIAGQIVLSVRGVKFRTKTFLRELPKANMFITADGNSLYSYNHFDDVLSGNCTLINSLNKEDYYQTHKDGDGVCVGKVNSLSGVYYYENINNYTNQICVAIEGNNGILLPNLARNNLAFVYRISDNIACKILQNNELSSEKILELETSYYPSKIMGTIAYTDNVKCFAVDWGNCVSVYLLKSDLEIVKLYETKVKNIKIYEFDNVIKVVEFDNLSVNIIELDTTNVQSQSGIVKLISKRQINNIIDYMFIDDIEIVVSSNGTKSVLENTYE